MRESHTLWERAVRFGFRLLYHELAWSYDLVSWVVSLGEWRRWQEAALPFLQSGQVLEIAHGPGHMLLRLAAVHEQVVGVDLSAAMSQQAKRRIEQANLAIPLLQASVHNLPFVDGYFDSILSTFPTAFILEGETLRELRRVLGKNGRLVVVPEGHLTGSGFLHTVIDWLFKITGQRSKAHATKENIWSAFSHQFTEAGFSVKVKEIQLKKSMATVIVAEKIS